MITLLAAGAALLDIAIIIKIAALFHAPSRAQIMRNVKHYGILAIFLLSAASIAGSLWLQYGADLTPCLFCWWQRICMYPIALISLIALIKGAELSDIADYVLGLSIIGALIALYQHFLQILPSGSLIPCDASDECAIRSVFEFHFVTLPWMAFSVFAAIALVAYVARSRAK